MSEEELKQFLKRLDSSCANGPSPMLLIFNAALTGIISSTHFEGPNYQGAPQSAVRFAAQVCVEAGC
jgi:hypothetical protein